MKTRDAGGVDANDGGSSMQNDGALGGGVTIPGAAINSPRRDLTVAGTFANRQTE